MSRIGVLIVMEKYVARHRKSLVGALSTALAAYSLQVANGAHAVDWRPIIAAVVAGVVGGGAVHQIKNAPPAP